MNLPVMKQILAKIKEYSRIIIIRHKRPDGDAVGSTKGLAGILRLTYPEKEIYLINEDYADYTAFLGAEDAAIPDEKYADALVIALDCGTTERLSNTKFGLGKELIKIDHHIDDKPYGDISWVEEDASSTCQLICEFWLAFKDELKIDKEAATCLYTGMVTDSGRFRYDGTSGDTLRAAGALLDMGVDLERLNAHLYLDDIDYIKLKANCYRIMKMTENGVAYLYISQAMQQKFNLTSEMASNTVGIMDSIKGSLIWLAFIENPDKTIRVRLRSRFVTCQDIATHYHGGGHAMASGATLYKKSEMKALLAEADAKIKEYKESHEDWL